MTRPCSVASTAFVLLLDQPQDPDEDVVAEPGSVPTTPSHAVIVGFAAGTAVPAEKASLYHSAQILANTATSWTHTVWPYVQIARIDHWFKNAFMLLGVCLALFIHPDLIGWPALPSLLAAVAVTCLVASSNYVLNELLDAPRDRLHPSKRHRPAALGLIKPAAAVTEWLLLAAVSISAAFALNTSFGFWALALWVMGCAYNIPPVRTKELPYIDVLSESVNNPIRLMLGWTILVPHEIPPLSLILAYWMVGAFFMATKRFAEYRNIDDKEIAAAYRSSFRHYNEGRLLVSMMFYLTAGALCSGIFLVRFRLELIFCAPVVAGFFAYYMLLGMRPDSPVQNPEKLYRQHGFFLYALATVTLFVVLMFLDMPFLYDWMNVDPANATDLWNVRR